MVSKLQREKPTRSLAALAGPALWLLTLMLAGCTHAPLNAPLPENGKPGGGYSMLAGDHRGVHDDTMIALYFSGGGIRASALSYGVLKGLADTRLPDGSSMLSRVSVINSVSGGSFTAAYYCLYGDRIFNDFEKIYLKQKLQDILVRDTFTPFLNARLASPYFARSDKAAEVYDDLLFHGATFADLEKRGGEAPFLVINATDMRTGGAVQFTQEQFDLWGSDLSSYPISRAVAASSAVPVLLSPIVVKNYPKTQKVANRLFIEADSPDDFLATLQSALRKRDQSYLDVGTHPFVYLVDGGLSDNLGLASLLEYVVREGGWGNLARRLDLAGIRRVVLIVVNAEKESEDVRYEDDRTPRSKDVLQSLSSALIERSNRTVIAMLRSSLDLWKAQERDQGLKTIDVHLATVEFHSIANEEERRYFLAVPTRFQLPDDVVDKIVAKGSELLLASPEYQRLMLEMKAH